MRHSGPEPIPSPPPEPARPEPEPERERGGAAPDSAAATPDHPASATATPHLPWNPKCPGESPTPAYLEAPRVPTRPDPRQPDDVRDAIPPPNPTPTPAPTPAPTPTPPLTPTPTARVAAAPEAKAPAPEAVAAAPSNGTPPPATEEAPRAPNASTELASRASSEVRSPTPAGDSGGAAPRRNGVSLVRSEAVTERRPAPGPGALLRPGSQRLPAFVGGGVLRHAW
ncbi:hypothetical protein ACFUP2_35695, partial [Streptomyces sp. NPDC057301]